jgi:hypothetical protein
VLKAQAAVTLAGLIHQLTIFNVATGLTIPVVYASVGVVVARHQPGNPVGWILIFFVVLLLVPLEPVTTRCFASASDTTASRWVRSPWCSPRC